MRNLGWRRSPHAQIPPYGRNDISRFQLDAALRNTDVGWLRGLGSIGFVQQVYHVNDFATVSHGSKSLL